MFKLKCIKNINKDTICLRLLLNWQLFFSVQNQPIRWQVSIQKLPHLQGMCVRVYFFAYNKKCLGCLCSSKTNLYTTTTSKIFHCIIIVRTIAPYNDSYTYLYLYQRASEWLVERTCTQERLVDHQKLWLRERELRKKEETVSVIFHSHRLPLSCTFFFIYS